MSHPDLIGVAFLCASRDALQVHPCKKETPAGFPYVWKRKHLPGFPAMKREVGIPMVFLRKTPLNTAFYPKEASVRY